MDRALAELGHSDGVQSGTAEDTRVRPSLHGTAEEEHDVAFDGPLRRNDPHPPGERTAQEKAGLIERTVTETVLRTLTRHLVQHHHRPREALSDAGEQLSDAVREAVPALLPPQGNDDAARGTPGVCAPAVLRTLLDPRPEHEGPPALAPHVLTPLRHCAVTVTLDESRTRCALSRLRGDNPHALVGDVDGRVILFSATSPVCDGLDVLYAVAPVEDGDTARAALLARHTLTIAESYRVGRLDAREVLPLTALLAQSDGERETFLSHCLGPLHKDSRHAHLLATLSVYLRHGMCAATAARALYVHRHTLEYRLRRVRELTGLDLRQPLHRLRAELALLLTGASGQTGDPPREGQKKRRRKAGHGT
ncbi:PucR family transcriptional regulator [Streptomyces flavidovirens]|uniref:PucR family transcriptional regulator n=1 Tax=Streptomyces flavidovirens TaxID=67298 RepID=UPI0036AFE0E8